MPFMKPVIRRHFDKTDRITLISSTGANVYYRPLSSDEHGHLWQRVDDPDLAETFTHGKIAEFEHRVGYKHEPKFFDKTRAMTRLRTKVDAFQYIPPREWPDILWQYEWCDLFLQAAKRKEVNRSDIPMQNFIDEAAKRIRHERPQGKTKRSGRITEFRDPPDGRTLLRWVKKLEAGGMDPAALRRGYHKCGKSNQPLHPDVEVLLEKYVQQWVDDRRLTKAQCYDDFKDAIEDLNATRKSAGEAELPLPSDKRFRQRIDGLPAFAVCVGRKGADKARREFQMNTTGLDVTRPGERVEIDAWRVSLQTLCIKAKIWDKLSRQMRNEVRRAKMWLAVAIDVATRCILAMRIGRTDSSAMARDLLRMAVSDKGIYADAVGALTPWDMNCRFDVAAMDMGSSLIDTTGRGIICSFGAIPDFPPAGWPEFRATVERLFGMLHTRLISRFTGRTHENPVKRGDYPAVEKASLTIDDLCWVLVRFVVDAYHNEPHPALYNQTPRQCWIERTQRYGALPIPGRDERRNIFGIRLTAKLDGSGVRFFNLYFQSDALHQHFMDVGETHVDIVVDEADLGWISVKIGDGYLTVKNSDPDLIGLCLQDWILVCAALRKRRKENIEIHRPVVRAAIKAITAVSDAAIKRANIGATQPKPETISRLERQLYLAIGLQDDLPPLSEGDPFAARPAPPSGDSTNPAEPTAPSRPAFSIRRRKRTTP